MVLSVLFCSDDRVFNSALVEYLLVADLLLFLLLVLASRESADIVDSKSQDYAIHCSQTAAAIMIP